MLCGHAIVATFLHHTSTHANASMENPHKRRHFKKKWSQKVRALRPTCDTFNNSKSAAHNSISLSV